MRLTITGADSLFARAAIGALCGEHAIRAVDIAFSSALPEGIDVARGDIRDRDFAAGVTDDAEVVLHLASLATAAMNDADIIDTFSRGSFNLVDMAIEQGVRRFIVASTLGMFDRLPAKWRVDESWRPRPEPTPEHLACWLSELSLRECCHTANIHAVCLRFGTIVTDEDISGRTFDARWVNIEDAVQGLKRALRHIEEPPSRGEWEIFHISGGDGAKIRDGRARGDKFGYKPAHDFSANFPGPSPAGPGGFEPGANWREALLPQPILQSNAARMAGSPADKRRVVIFGAAGPVAAALAEEIQDAYLVRQTDIRPLADVRGENRPQSEGAPLPALLPAPHEERVVDVRDYSQVLAACEGMDAIVNCSVVRPDAVEAFRVNTLGAYNVMRSAVEHGIRRVVQTGPQQHGMDSRTGYWWDYDVPGDAPARPGRNLYAHSKFLGQEICRVFADYYGLEVPVLLYMQFLNPAVTGGLALMAVSWHDSARALRAALEVESLPSPYEEMVITSDLPHGRHSARRAKEILGWEAEDDLSPLWRYR